LVRNLVGRHDHGNRQDHKSNQHYQGDSCPFVSGESTLANLSKHWFNHGVASSSKLTAVLGSVVFGSVVLGSVNSIPANMHMELT